MPFATIAVLILIMIYLFYLTILQLMSGQKRDITSSLPIPPRALTGNAALPVLGHTILFHKYGSDMAFMFPPEWREWRCFPWSRRLGDTYSVFVWGQWNIVAKGRERIERIIAEGDISEGWPYNTPPVTLLGKTCPAFLDEDEARCLRSMISEPMSHAAVVKQAPQFAELAQKCIDEIIAGHFVKGEQSPLRPEDSKHVDETEGRQCEDDLLNTTGPNSNIGVEKTQEVKLDALRSFTLDLMQGPVLHLDRDYRDMLATVSHQKNLSSRSLESELEKRVRLEDGKGPEESELELPSREMLLQWMDRLKEGLCDIKFTYGPEWMQLWRINPYGRALNARRKLGSLLGAHIEEREKLIPVHHEKGRATRDPFSSAMPLWRITERYFSRSEHPVLGFRKSKIAETSRARTRSENDLDPEHEKGGLSPIQLTGRPRYRAQSEPYILDVERESARAFVNKSGKKIQQCVLDQILGAADYEGRGITRVATTEVTLLLWMMMDAGQAWTSMALYLLSKHESAGHQIQAEIDRLEEKYKDRLFTSFVLAKMEKLDNLIFEAMRICPAFMGGLKTVNKTIELDGVQVPKNATVLLSYPHDEDSFTIDYNPPRKPEEMGMHYPSIDLYGLLPLQGLEIPIMVLQTKIFLIVLLQNQEIVGPGRRQNFIQRITDKISKSLRSIRSPSSNDMNLRTIQRNKSIRQISSAASSNDVSMDSIRRNRSVVDLNELEKGNSASLTAPTTPTRSTRGSDMSSSSIARLHKHLEIRHDERLFTRVPFPEPLRPVRIRHRADKILFPPPTNGNLAKPPMADRVITR